MCVHLVSRWASLLGVVLGCGFIAVELLQLGGVLTTADMALASQALSDVAGTSVDLDGTADVFAASASVEQSVYAIAGWTMAALSVVLLVLLIALWSYAGSAVNTLRQASQAVRANMSLLSLPLSSVLLLLALGVWWATIMLYLISAGQMSALRASVVLINRGAPSVTGLSNANLTPLLVFVHTFVCLWTALFYRAVLSTTTAGVVASWHFVCFVRAPHYD